MTSIAFLLKKNHLSTDKFIATLSCCVRKIVIFKLKNIILYKKVSRSIQISFFCFEGRLRRTHACHLYERRVDVINARLLLAPREFH